MPICTNCQSEVADEANACPNCGAVFEESIDQQTGGYSTPGADLATTYGFIAGLSIVFLLLSAWNSITRPIGSTLAVTFSTQPLFYIASLAGVGFWLTTAVGIRRQSERSVRAAFYALAALTVINLVGFSTYMSRYAMPGPGYAEINLPLMDPLSNFVTVLGIGRVRLPVFANDALLLIGTVLLIGMTFYLYKQKPALTS